MVNVDRFGNNAELFSLILPVLLFVFALMNMEWEKEQIWIASMVFTICLVDNS